MDEEHPRALGIQLSWHAHPEKEQPHLPYKSIKQTLAWHHALKNLQHSSLFTPTLCSMTHTWGPESQTLMRGMDVLNRLGYNFIAYAPAALLRWSIWAGAFVCNNLVMPLMRGMQARTAVVEVNMSRSMPS